MSNSNQTAFLRPYLSGDGTADGSLGGAISAALAEAFAANVPDLMGGTVMDRVSTPSYLTRNTPDVNAAVNLQFGVPNTKVTPGLYKLSSALRWYGAASEAWADLSGLERHQIKQGTDVSKYMFEGDTGSAVNRVGNTEKLVLVNDLSLYPDTAGYVFDAGELLQLFGAPTAAEMAAGRTHYKCVYMKNDSAYKIYQSWVYIYKPSINGIGYDVYVPGAPAAAGTVAGTIGDATTSPGGAFSAPDMSGGIEAGAIDVGEYIPVWIRQTIPAGFTRFSFRDTISIAVGFLS